MDRQGYSYIPWRDGQTGLFLYPLERWTYRVIPISPGKMERQGYSYIPWRDGQTGLFLYPLERWTDRVIPISPNTLLAGL